MKTFVHTCSDFDGQGRCRVCGEQIQVSMPAKPKPIEERLAELEAKADKLLHSSQNTTGMLWVIYLCILIGFMVSSCTR